MRYIEKMLPYVRRTKREWAFLLYGTIVGLVLPPSYSTIVAGYSLFSHKTLSILCLSLSLTTLALIASFILLYDRYKYTRKRLKNFAPSLDIDDERAFVRGYKNA